MSYGSPFPPAPQEPPPAGPTQGVHPITIGRAFELSWRMLRYRWRALIGAAALLLVPVYAFQTIVQLYTGPVINAWVAAWEEWAQDTLPTQPAPPLPELPAGFFEALLLAVLAGIVAAFVAVLAGAAVIHAAGLTYSGGEPTARGSAGHALRRAASLIGAQLLIFLAVLGLVLLGFGGGVLLIAQGAGLAGFGGVLLLVATVVAIAYVNVRWAFFQQAIMLEEQGALTGLGSSWRLVGGSLLRVLGYMIVLTLTLGLLAGLVMAVTTSALTGGQPAVTPPAIFAEALVTLLVTLLITPYTTILLTLLYFDIRWRKSGLLAAAAPPYQGQPPYGGGPGQPPYGGPPAAGGPDRPTGS